jgi:hypothetical protein
VESILDIYTAGLKRKFEGRRKMALRKNWIFSGMRMIALVVVFLALWAAVSWGVVPI